MDVVYEVFVYEFGGIGIRFRLVVRFWFFLGLICNFLFVVYFVNIFVFALF